MTARATEMLEAASSLATTTVRSVAWLGGAQALRQLNSVLTAMLLARILSPNDYGVFAMMYFVNELAQLVVDFGIGSALIQRKEVEQRMLSTCFWINVVVGGLTAAVVAATGPLAAAYFKQPLIASLLLVSAFNLGLSALGVLPQALLARRLDFRHIALGGLIGSLASSAVALTLAYRGFGVWALVWQPLVGTLVTFGYLARQAHWLPSLTFDLGSVRGMIRFSGHLFGSNLISHFARNFHQIIVGPVLGAPAMGAISLAQTVAWLPIAQVTTASVKAIYPVFASIQDSRDRMATGMMRALEMVTLLTFPMVFSLAALADIVTPVLFGPQWEGTAPLVAVFCAHSAVQCICFVAGSTLLASGNSRIGLVLTILSAVLMGGTMFALRETNALVVSIGFVAASSVTLLAGFVIAVRDLALPWPPLISCIARPALAATLTSLALLVLKVEWVSIEVHLRLLALLVLATLCYLGLTWLINRGAWISAVGVIRESFKLRRR